MAQDLSVNGNLDVSGQADIHGNTWTLGSWQNDPTQFGLTLGYNETVDANGISNAMLRLSVNRDIASWIWEHNTTTGMVSSLKLDEQNQLLIYKLNDPTNGIGITLNPDGTSIFENSVVIKGTDNQLPNQTITAGGSLLTVGLADQRYVLKGTLSFGNGTSAAGVSATALGDGTNANGNYSTTTGHWTEAVGDSSTALGYFTIANGNASTSMGYVTAANGDSSMAMGDFTTAQALDQVVIGRVNVIQGDPYNWVETDDAFIIGNGSYSWNSENNAWDLSPSNAFTVKKNGDTWMAGGLTVSANARFNGAVRIEPQGDLSMGSFTAEPQ